MLFFEFKDFLDIRRRGESAIDIKKKVIVETAVGMSNS